MDKSVIQFERLLNIMDDLREKCPWDKKQTLESLRHLTIEETYELSDAIIENDLDELKGEIGDLLLHMVLCEDCEVKAAFTISDVLEFLCEKLIRRHPHIYDDVQALSEEEGEIQLGEDKTRRRKGIKEKEISIRGLLRVCLP